MKREELISSREYWLTKIQLDLFNMIEVYRKENNLNKTQLAEKMGVTKGYVTQILNGDFDHRISKVVELSIMFGKVPFLNFMDVGKYKSEELKLPSVISSPTPYPMKPKRRNAIVVNERMKNPSKSKGKKAIK